MNPSVKGYFVYGPYFALIGDIDVYTMLGLRNRHYVTFKVALWDDQHYEGQPTFLRNAEGNDLWCVELDRSDLSVEQIESYCIYVTLKQKLKSELREPTARKRSTETTVEIQGRKVAATVVPIRLTERVVRDLYTHELTRQDTACLYRVNAGESNYEFTLYYNSDVGNLAATDLIKGPVFTLCLNDLAKRTLT